MSAGYLLDTSVLSALAPGRPSLPPALVNWLRERTKTLFIPTIAVAEIEEGVTKLRRAGGGARADLYAAWLDGLIRDYGERVLALDAVAARMTGALSDAAKAAGRHPGFPDAAIAAIASVRGLTILTRNLRHFQALGVQAVDPFLSLPA